MDFSSDISFESRSIYHLLLFLSFQIKFLTQVPFIFNSISQRTICVTSHRYRGRSSPVFVGGPNSSFRCANRKMNAVAAPSPCNRCLAVRGCRSGLQDYPGCCPKRPRAKNCYERRRRPCTTFFRGRFIIIVVIALNGRER